MTRWIKVYRDLWINRSRTVVTSVLFYLIDLDGTPPDEEHATISAFDGGGVVQFVSLAGAPENDGAALEVVLTGNAITSVLIDVSPRPSTGMIGWAIDSLTFARPCPNPGCTPRFRISQESAPGIGDYANNTDTYALTAVNLLGTSWPVLKFGDRYRIAENDWGRLEVSADGSGWTPLYGIVGVRNDWAGGTLSWIS